MKNTNTNTNFATIESAINEAKTIARLAKITALGAAGVAFESAKIDEAFANMQIANGVWTIEVVNQETEKGSEMSENMMPIITNVEESTEMTENLSETMENSVNLTPVLSDSDITLPVQIPSMDAKSAKSIITRINELIEKYNADMSMVSMSLDALKSVATAEMLSTLEGNLKSKFGIIDINASTMIERMLSEGVIKIGETVVTKEMYNDALTHGETPYDKLSKLIASYKFSEQAELTRLLEILHSEITSLYSPVTTNVQYSINNVNGAITLINTLKVKRGSEKSEKSEGEHTVRAKYTIKPNLTTFRTSKNGRIDLTTDNAGNWFIASRLNESDEVKKWDSAGTLSFSQASLEAYQVITSATANRSTPDIWHKHNFVISEV